MKIPPTRNHRQLAGWINGQRLVDATRGIPVRAVVESVRTSTDSKVAGTRFRRVGKGRVGLRLEIWPVGASPWRPEERLYKHVSSETYRKHGEARAWVEQNLSLPQAGKVEEKAGALGVSCPRCGVAPNETCQATHPKHGLMYRPLIKHPHRERVAEAQVSTPSNTRTS